MSAGKRRSGQRWNALAPGRYDSTDEPRTMSVSTIQDPAPPSPPDGLTLPDKSDAAVIAGGGALDSRPRPKVKKPRPTFEDGALTRLFKFPSKTYPRSTYYVTGDEIIIRIKKARKKWKLIVPKKRLVSYRTNRWFAKPRWVEIELTYTQAVRLGLAEARAQSVATPPGGPAQPSDAAIDEHLLSAATDAGHDGAGSAEEIRELDTAADETDDAAGSDESAAMESRAVAQDSAVPLVVLPEGPDAAQDGRAEELDLDLDLDLEPPPQTNDDPTAAAMIVGPPAAEEPAAARPEPTADAATCSTGEGAEPASASGQGDRPQDDELQRAAASGDTELTGVFDLEPARTVNRPDDEHERQPLAPPVVEQAEPAAEPAMAWPRDVAPPAAAKKRSRNSLGASLLLIAPAVALISASTAWLPLGDEQEALVASNPACSGTEKPGSCIQPVTTGSISRPETERSPIEPDVAVPSGADAQPAAPAISPDLAGTPAEPEIALFSTPPAENQPVADAGPPLESVRERDDTNAAKPAGSSDPVAERPIVLPRLMLGEATCRTLSATAHFVSIQFEYASAGLEHAFVDALDSLAERIKACPAARVVLQGHTDSDGDADRNQALSVRRAQTVQEHLIKAGIDPARLSVVGFGHSRPSAPNITADNKRSNRRVVLSVDAPL